MSANPFRRSHPPPALQPASAAGLDGSRVLSDDWPPADQKAPARTKKHVRLASPPASPPEPSSPEVGDNLARRLSAAHHAGSPPPPPADLSDASSDDTIDEPSEDSPVNEDDEDDDAPLKPATSGHPTRMDTLSRTSGVPNPFERNLANIEPATQQNAFDLEKAGTGARTAADQSASHKAKGSMDVDSFKRLLMTGSAAPAPSIHSPTAGVQPRAHITIGGDTSSGTDASSASRNSLFESVLQVHEDSPRSSYERTSFDAGGDDDQSTLIGGDRRPEKKKPPPPKHRHGKSITRAPQVVSFSDFSPTFDSKTMRPEAPKRTPSDVHKPLPPRPRGSSGPKGKELPSSPPAEPVPPKDTVEPPPTVQLADESPSTKATEQPAPPQRRKPPTPPISRRHSQLRSSDARSRSNSAATLSSQQEETIPSSEQTPTTSPPPSTTFQNKPPPPPPTRRSGAPSSAAEVSTHGLSRSSSRRSTASSMQNPSLSLRSSNRLSGSAFDITSPTTAGGPPPPPPRRGSSKSSFEMQRPSASILAAAGVGESRRSSGDFKGRSRTASGTSERVLAEYSSKAEEVLGSSGNGVGEVGGGGGGLATRGGGGVDLLSELDKLQQEVEALRQKSTTKA